MSMTDRSVVCAFTGGGVQIGVDIPLWLLIYAAMTAVSWIARRRTR
jgi:hypothetical protein